MRSAEAGRGGAALREGGRGRANGPRGRTRAKPR